MEEDTLEILEQGRIAAGGFIKTDVYLFFFPLIRAMETGGVYSSFCHLGLILVRDLPGPLFFLLCDFDLLQNYSWRKHL